MFKPTIKCLLKAICLTHSLGVGRCHSLLAQAETNFPTFPSGRWSQPQFRFLLKTAQNWMRPFELPVGAGWKGCMWAMFAFPQPHAVTGGQVSSVPAHCWCSSTVLAPELAPPGQATAALEQHPPFCFCLGKGYLPSPCHSHLHPSTIPFPDPGHGFHSRFGHTWINLSLLSASQQFPHFLPSWCLFYFRGCSISCYVL